MFRSHRSSLTLASWAEDQERSRVYDDELRREPGFRPDPKPAKRVKADVRDWETMRTLLDEGCQLCGSFGWEEGYGLSLHHLVSRSLGGDDVRENLAPLCGHGTVGCHGDVEARRNDARGRLRERLTLEQRRYVLGKKGYAWLVKNYPPVQS